MTWLAVRIHFEVFFFGEIDPDLLIYDLAFLKCNDKDKSCVNARRDILAAFHKGAFHESEPSSSRTLNKIALVLYQLSYEDPAYFSSKPIFFQAINRHNLYVAKMSIVCASRQLQIQMLLTYKICNEERPAKTPCGISSIMLFDKFLQQIKIRNLH